MQQRSPSFILIALCVLAVVNMPAGVAMPGVAAPKRSATDAAMKRAEGPVLAAEILVGPFDLHRRYRSMEGPYVRQKFRLSDLLESHQVALPEAMVTFIEGGGEPAGMSAGPPMTATETQPVASAIPVGLVDTRNNARELYWFKGMKLDVLDENDKPLPTAEFICHLNLDVVPSLRNQLFPEGERCGNGRILTLTQGQTEFYFPEGFAVPVASEEQWTFTFQAANRTTDQHRRIKHRCRLYLVKDSELVYPVKALHWYAPYVSVIVDRDTAEAATAQQKNHPECLAMSPGVNAPNSVPGSTFNDKFNRKLSGHWVVPPGVHTYSSPIVDERDSGFGSKDRRIHAVWTHLHPLCTKTSLVRCDRDQRRKVLEAHAKTSLAGGLELKEIGTIYSKEGIPLAAGQHYELEAIYENKTDKPQDSMVVMGIFFADDKFARPDWRADSNKKSPAFCGVTSSTVATAPKKDEASCNVKIADKSTSSGDSNNYPLFDIKNDGPLIKEAKTMELDTTAGKIHLVLDPGLAPQHATQLYRLMKNGAFDGTPIFRYEPNFVIQTAVAEEKVAGQPPLSGPLRNLLRRLPLEVEAQTKGLIAHKQWVLSMGRWDHDPNSGVSSFSMLISDAPHLNNKYTIFGRIVLDPITSKTIQQIKDQWPTSHPWIIKTSEM